MSKILTRNEDNIVIYAFPNSTDLDIRADKIVVNEPIPYIIADRNSSNTTEHVNVSLPDNHVVWKHMYNGSAWSNNPDWVDPSEGN